MEPPGILESECQTTLTEAVEITLKKSLSLWIFSSPFYSSMHFRTLNCHNLQVQYTKWIKCTTVASLTLSMLLSFWRILSGVDVKGTLVGQIAIWFFSAEKRPVKRAIYCIKPFLSCQRRGFLSLPPQRQCQMNTWNFTAKFQNSIACSPVTAWWERAVRSGQNPV